MSEEIAVEHANLVEALLAFQAEAPTLYKGEEAKVKTKSGAEYSYRYIGLDTIMETIQPLLTKHGLVWTTLPTQNDSGRPELEYRLLHAPTSSEEPGTYSGDVLVGRMPLLVAGSDAQAFGSAITYARRYALTAVLNLVADEDDDAHRAITPDPPAQQTTQHKDDQRPAAPRIPADRAQTILQAALACKMATLDLEAAPGTPPTFHPAFKAKLALENVAKIGELNVDSAESVEAFLVQEREGQGV